MMQIRKADDHDIMDDGGIDPEQTNARRRAEANSEHETEQAKLLRASKISKWTTVAMTLAFLILWPFPLYGSSYVFSKQFFTGWVTVGIIWIFISLGAVGVFPVWEGRKTLVHTVKSIFLDLSGRKHPKVIHAERAVPDDESSTSPDSPSKKESAMIDEKNL